MPASRLFVPESRFEGRRSPQRHVGSLKFLADLYRTRSPHTPRKVLPPTLIETGGRWQAWHEREAWPPSLNFIEADWFTFRYSLCGSPRSVVGTPSSDALRR